MRNIEMGPRFFKKSPEGEKISSKMPEFLTGLSATLDILLNRLNLEKEEREILRNSLKEKIEGVGEYDREKIIESVENGINEAGVKDETKERILKQILSEKEGKKYLDSTWEKELEAFFKEKGPILINFKDKIEKGLNPEEAEKYLKSYIYLLSPKENLEKLSPETQKELQGALEKLLSQKQEFRKWWTLGLKKGVETPSFVKELVSYYEDLAKGKDAIRLTFGKKLFDKLPEEIQSNFENLGIKKENGDYVMELKRENLLEILKRKVEREKEILLKEAEFKKLTPEARELVKRAKKIFKNYPELTAEIGVLSKELDDIIKEISEKGKEEGLSAEELEKGIKQIREEIFGPLNEMFKLAEEMPPDWKKKYMKEGGKLKKIWETLGSGMAIGFGLGMFFTFFWMYLLMKITEGVINPEKLEKEIKEWTGISVKLK